MDGIEWKRQKWGLIAKTWFYLNELAGLWLGNHLVADHPGIKQHLQRAVNPNKITMIPYGADRVAKGSEGPLGRYGLKSGQYGILIARPEPENSILEVVQAYSQKFRGMPLVVLGNYKDDHAYQASVKTAASDEVLFVGAIYDKQIVQALRAHCRFYVHGHQVGGPTPLWLRRSVPEIRCLPMIILLTSGSRLRVPSILAMWQVIANQLDRLLSDDQLILSLQENALKIHSNKFTWETIASPNMKCY